MAIMAPDELLTSEEVARFLKVSEFTIRARLKSGELEGMKIGGQWRITRTALNDYINRHSRHTKPKTNQK